MKTTLLEEHTPVICPNEKCGMTFSNKYCLNRHMATHKIFKDHICHFCGKGFALA